MEYQVFKFGGASVKSAEAVRNVADILNRYSGQKLMVVISAMAKTTNELEKLLSAYRNKLAHSQQIFEAIKLFHFQTFRLLIPNENLLATQALTLAFDELEAIISSPILDDEAEDYARIVGFGEIFATLIVYHYLLANDYSCQWIAATDCITTDNQYLEATVDWKRSPQQIKDHLIPEFEHHDIVISQGFIARTSEGKISTLGREGSDYSAAIFAYALDAKCLTIWKDVPGLLNADPKFFDNTQKIDFITYRETIELAYYGASIIHPKTIQPLQNKKIPLHIKSFIEPLAEGSIIQAEVVKKQQIPSYIFKKEQVLISIASRDFAFIAEQHLSQIFDKLAAAGLKINMMQNSAISFSICMDYKAEPLFSFIESLQRDFNVKYNEHMELITIQHYNQSIIDNLIGSRKIYLEQKNRTTVQLLVR